MVSASGLIPLLVVYLFDSLFPGVCSVYRFGVVVRDVGCLAGSGDGVVVFVNEFHEMTSLLVGDLHVLAYHQWLKLKEILKVKLT